MKKDKIVRDADVTWSWHGFDVAIRFNRHGKVTAHTAILRDYYDYVVLTPPVNGKRVRFTGNDFSPSPLYAWDAPETMLSLLGYITVQEGDTEEFFAKYTTAQTEWANSFECEQAAWEVQETMEATPE